MWEVIGLAICLFWTTWKHRDCIVFFLLTFLSNSGARFFLITLAVGLLPLRDMTQGNISGDEENTDTSHISPGQGIRLEQICRFHLPSSCDASQSTFCASSLIFFTIPLKYNDVTRQTVPDSDSAADCWTIDGAITLSDDWVVRTRFQLLRPRALATVVKQRFGTVHDLNQFGLEYVENLSQKQEHHDVELWDRPKYSLPVETEGSVTFPLDDDEV